MKRHETEEDCIKSSSVTYRPPFNTYYYDDQIKKIEVGWHAARMGRLGMRKRLLLESVREGPRRRWE
jgi:hypothetical protein